MREGREGEGCEGGACVMVGMVEGGGEVRTDV